MSNPIPAASPILNVPQLLPIFQRLEQSIAEKNYSEALSDLTTLILAREAPEKIYPPLFLVIPHLSNEEIKLLLNRIPSLLNDSSHLPIEQARLALQLGNFWSRSSKEILSYHTAMHYYAKAISIAEKIQDQALLQEAHQLASCLFVQIIFDRNVEPKTFVTTALQEAHRLTACRLVKITFDPNMDSRTFMTTALLEKLEHFVAQIEMFRRFCTDPKDLGKVIYPLYRELQEALKTTVLAGSGAMYESLAKSVIDGINKAWSAPLQFVTAIYREKLIQFRNGFDPIAQPIREFQRGRATEFRGFLKLLVEEVFALIGEPPCAYDIRAMGSLAREEVCPFSDLEYFILIQDEAGRDYFKTFAQVLKLKVLSLGETMMGDIPVFTYLGPDRREGFHLDQCPAGCCFDLIRTPKAMAEHQRENCSDPEPLKKMVLTSVSLKTNDESLFADYTKELAAVLAGHRKERAVGLLKKRVEESGDPVVRVSPRPVDTLIRWKMPFHTESVFHVKKQYVELIHHALSDLALYFEISEANTLDVIQVLAQKAVFTQGVALLLTAAIEEIYRIRLRLHREYAEQKEEGYFPSRAPAPPPGIKPLLESEIKALEKAYYLVLQPLYWKLEKVFSYGSIDKDFTQVDLVREAFRWTSSLKTNISIDEYWRLMYAIQHIAEKSGDLSTHREYYLKLSRDSRLESFRKYYIKLLEAKGKNTIARELISTPNREGLRQSAREQIKRFQGSLKTIVADQPEKSEKLKIDFVKVSCPSLRGGKEGSFLRREVIEQILDAGGEIVKVKREPDDLHNVSSAQGNGYNLHFKQSPGQPLMEYAVHNLISRIAGGFTPETELVRFEVQIQGKPKVYPVLISNTIVGKTLRERLREPLKLSLEAWRQWVLMALCSILVRPGDGRLSNYIMDPNDFISCIDNDISFVEPVVWEGFFSGKKVNFHSALFAVFEEDKPIDLEALKEFYSLDADLILHSWIEDIIRQEKVYTDLFSSDQDIRTTILFREGTLATLNLQFRQLQHYLITCLDQKKTVYLLDLLNQVIALKDIAKVPVGSFIYSQYKKSLALPSISKRLEFATSRKQEQSLSVSQSAQATLGKIPTAEEVEKRQLYAPEKAKEELFHSLLSQTVDIHVGEIQKKKAIQADFKNVRLENGPDLSRQELILEALTHFLDLEGKKPTTIILRHCAVLNMAKLQPFLYLKLSVLDISYSPLITDKDVEEIVAKVSLSEFYLNGCSQLKKLFVRIPRRLVASEAERYLKILSISRCPNLQSITINSAIGPEILTASFNPQLKQVNIEIETLPRLDFQGSPQIDVEKERRKVWTRYCRDRTCLDAPFAEDSFSKFFGLSNKLRDQLLQRAANRMVINQPNIVQLNEISFLIYNNDPSFTTLSLNHLPFNVHTRIRFLFTAMKHNSHLKNCELVDCPIGDWAASDIANMLTANASLQTLNLSCNSIGDTGAGDLAGALKSNRSLTELHLSLNRLTEEGATVLIDAWKQSGRPLKNLFLWSRQNTQKAVSSLLSNGTIPDAVFTLLPSLPQNLITQELWKQRGLFLTYVEALSKDKSFEEILFGVIETSKTDPAFATAAANSITLLNAAGVSFEAMDLTGIQIPGAYLVGANFTRASLEGANLENVILKDSCLDQCSLQAARMEGVQFDQRAPLQVDGALLTNGLSMSPDEKWLFVGTDLHVHVFDLNNGESSSDWRHSSYGWGEGRVNAFSAHENWFAVAGNQLILYFFLFKDITTYNADPVRQVSKRTLGDHTEGVNACSFSLDGQWLATAEGANFDSKDCKVYLWNPATGKLMATLAGHRGSVSSCVFSKNHQRLATAGHDETVRIWEIPSGKLLRTLKGHEAGAWFCAFSPTNPHLLAVAAANQRIYLWDSEKGQPLRVLRGSSEPPDTAAFTFCSFSPDGQWLAAIGTWSRKIYLWNLAKSDIYELRDGQHKANIVSCIFSPDSKWILTGGEDGAIRFQKLIDEHPPLNPGLPRPGPLSAEQANLASIKDLSEQNRRLLEELNWAKDREALWKRCANNRSLGETYLNMIKENKSIAYVAKPPLKKLKAIPPPQKKFIEWFKKMVSVAPESKGGSTSGQNASDGRSMGSSAPAQNTFSEEK